MQKTKLHHSRISWISICARPCWNTFELFGLCGHKLLWSDLFVQFLLKVISTPIFFGLLYFVKNKELSVFLKNLVVMCSAATAAS